MAGSQAGAASTAGSEQERPDRATGTLPTCAPLGTGMRSGWLAIRQACNQAGMQSGRHAIRQACNQDGMQSGRHEIKIACNQAGMQSGEQQRPEHAANGCCLGHLRYRHEHGHGCMQPGRFGMHACACQHMYSCMFSERERPDCDWPTAEILLTGPALGASMRSGWHATRQACNQASS
jgi:hypothetical protein